MTKFVRQTSDPARHPGGTSHVVRVSAAVGDECFTSHSLQILDRHDRSVRRSCSDPIRCVACVSGIGVDHPHMGRIIKCRLREAAIYRL